MDNNFNIQVVSRVDIEFGQDAEGNIYFHGNTYHFLPENIYVEGKKFYLWGYRYEEHTLSFIADYRDKPHKFSGIKK